MIKPQLLCTFTNSKSLTSSIDNIVKTYDVLYNKIFVLQNIEDNRDLMCTYNVEQNIDFTALQSTISLHRKKQTNTLYTINALNELIKIVNNGVLDTTYQLDWEKYSNSVLLTGEEGLKRIDVKVKEIIYIKIKN